MDPHIALQLLLTLAKISGTILAIFLAVVIFALRDEDLARIILLKEPRGYYPLIIVLLTCFLLASQILFSLLCIFDMNLEAPFNDFRMVFLLAVFVISLVFVFAVFGILLMEKREFLQARVG